MHVSLPGWLNTTPRYACPWCASIIKGFPTFFIILRSYVPDGVSVVYRCKLILFNLANKANYDADEPVSAINSDCTLSLSHSLIISLEWFYITPTPSHDAIQDVTHALTHDVPLSPAPTSTNIRLSSC